MNRLLLVVSIFFGLNVFAENDCNTLKTVYETTTKHGKVNKADISKLVQAFKETSLPDAQEKEEMRNELRQAKNFTEYGYRLNQKFQKFCWGPRLSAINALLPSFSDFTPLQKKRIRRCSPCTMGRRIQFIWYWRSFEL